MIQAAGAVWRHAISQGVVVFKLLAMLIAFLVVALMLLSLRQRRLELTAETSKIYSQIREDKEKLLDGKVDIARKSSPTALATALQNSGVDTGTVIRGRGTGSGRTVLPTVETDLVPWGR